MNWTLFVTLCVGYGLGLVTRLHWQKTRYELLQDTSAKSDKRWADEVHRLRAQVALHIGKDKT